MDKAVQTIRGELTNNLTRITKLDDHIAMEEQKLDEGDSVGKFSKRRVAERLRNPGWRRLQGVESFPALSLRETEKRTSRIRNEDTMLVERDHALFLRHSCLSHLICRRSVSKLDKKAATALHGFIGFVVSWHLGLLSIGRVTPQNPRTIFFIVGGLFFVVVRHWLVTLRRQPKRK